MMKTLLIITTKDDPKFLDEALSTLKDDLAVIVINDGFDDSGEVLKVARKYNVSYIAKKWKGLTDSWNIGYKHFVDLKYEHCIICNDDVRFTKGFSTPLIEGTELFDLVGPLTNQPGHQSLQYSDGVLKKSKRTYVSLPHINGFCFAFSKGIEKFKYSDELLFDPSNINIQNEDDLCSRIRNHGGMVAMCSTSFVFHYKDVTLKRYKKDKKTLK